MAEVWRQINEWYDVSDHGRVRSWKCGNWKKWYISKKPQILKTLTQRNYPYVVLRIDGERKKHSVHRLVAKAFIPNPDNKETVNHINGDRANNHANNLEWATQSENMIHAYENNLASNTGNNHKNRKISDKEAEEIRNRYSKGDVYQWQLADEYGLDQSHISNIVNGKRWRKAC